MKKSIIFIALLINGYVYSQELMNFYIEPNSTNNVTLHTMVFNYSSSALGGYSLTTVDNVITVALCYLNSSFQLPTIDPQVIDIDLPNGYSAYTINIELFGDNDAVQPCSLENLVDIGSMSFEYPYNPTATTYIPDNIFENYLEDFGFGDDIPNNDSVFTHRIINNSHLLLNDQYFVLPGDIYDMEGIQYFLNLKVLRCSNNQITNLDLSTNLLLKILLCGSNPLTQLNISNNELLIFLSCRNTELTTIDLLNNVNLEEVEIGQNSIASIDLSQNTSLINLGIDDNLLDNLNIDNNILLEYLSCNDNLINSLALSNNTNLINLSVEGNLLTVLNISNLYNLKRFDASNNQITTLDFSSNPQLEWFFLFNTNLISLNLKNGNNANITDLILLGNDNLYCIEVDYPEEAPYPGWNVNSQVVFSEECILDITEQTLQDAIQLYPNPVKNTLQINTENNITIKSIAIFDVLGKKVLATKNTTQIDVSVFTSGLLFVKIATDRGVVVKKVVKE